MKKRENRNPAKVSEGQRKRMRNVPQGADWYAKEKSEKSQKKIPRIFHEVLTMDSRVHHVHEGDFRALLEHHDITCSSIGGQRGRQIKEEE